mmetsp:Transcript_30646/g.78256  ORF Transcript_30646/g.78256 Transcript_30646/m.78256 type:complete len:314 (-) Transcript_30646:268-1209(-)|eukprot:CAMPEP_0202857542 /NCGR_PEP_ID=MMETSP1391-20130828/444_1 /ASSEMBLY_ACC=CAM_ASM_000867 /TAXON_ID=1034604 /ORGANISM="Chlamydomonas leiostraca, Strain SAG 11-49" /LENGTH=313 /DNA_ID=CAMNT_0049536355 /DNA_START=18 /DNA_END=959 /DNA_ORIENTATION=-
MDSLKHFAHGIYKKTAEAVTGPLKNSQFDQKGVLTPDEFVQAGDFLVRACPTWSWEGGDPKKRRPYLPADKQFLVTRNVPCVKRASEVESYNPNSEFALGGDEEGWVATHNDPNAAPARKAAGDDAIPSIDDAAGSAPSAAAAGGDDDIPDISELELGGAQDEAALPVGGGAGKAGGSGKTYLTAEEPADTIMRTRTYDLYITYDQYYQVPRLWLAGYDESRHPLSSQQVLEDVSEEHARKTITVDPHPHLSPPLPAASIHPCRHAEVMKRLVDNLAAAGKSFEVSHYLVLFLKFIASVVPTIQYDYTMSVGS